MHPLRNRSVALVAIGGDSRHSGRTGHLFEASLQEPSPMYHGRGVAGVASWVCCLSGLLWGHAVTDRMFHTAIQGLWAAGL